MSITRVYSLLGDSNIRNHVNKTAVRANAAIKAAQVISCGHVENFVEALKSVHDTCHVTCQAGSWQPQEQPSSVHLRERTTPLCKHLDHTHSQKSGIRMDTTTLTDPESENKADKAKTLPLANTQGNRGDQQQVGSHTSILRKTRKSGSSKIPRSGGTNPHGYNPGPTEVIVSSPRLSRSVYQSFSRLLISLFQGYPTVLLRTAFLCLFSEKDRVLSLPVTMELTIDARHQKHFSLTD